MARLSRRTVLLAALAAPVTASAGTTNAGDALAVAARAQIGVTRSYDPNYRQIAYPGGDTPRGTGVCADVVIRAARDAWDVDLQRLVHEDMRADFSAYPSHRTWGLNHPDANIDHRRVLNLETYWRRCGARTWLSVKHAPGFTFEGPMQAGDLLTWRLDGRLPHVAVVESGGVAPVVIHNIGRGVERWPLAFFAPHVAIAHYRWRPAVRA